MCCTTAGCCRPRTNGDSSPTGDRDRNVQKPLWIVVKLQTKLKQGRGLGPGRWHCQGVTKAVGAGMGHGRASRKQPGRLQTCQPGSHTAARSPALPGTLQQGRERRAEDRTSARCPSPDEEATGEWLSDRGSHTPVTPGACGVQPQGWSGVTSRWQLQCPLPLSFPHSLALRTSPPGH